MLSPQTLSQLQELFANQNTYAPNAAVTAALQSKSLCMIVGASCEGKNSVMQAVTEADPRFRICGTFTSREPRPSDDPALYTYIENSDTGLRDLFSRITAQQVVQYAVNPYAQLIYGSTITDYPGEHNLADVFSSAVASFEQLNFGQTVAITVISSPAAWLRRFEERFPVGHPQRQARRDEALESFTWSLAQTGPSHALIENIEGALHVTAQNVIRIIDGGSVDSTHAHELLQASLQAAESIVT